MIERFEAAYAVLRANLDDSNQRLYQEGKVPDRLLSYFVFFLRVLQEYGHTNEDAMEFLDKSVEGLAHSWVAQSTTFPQYYVRALILTQENLVWHYFFFQTRGWPSSREGEERRRSIRGLLPAAPEEGAVPLVGPRRRVVEYPVIPATLDNWIEVGQGKSAVPDWGMVDLALACIQEF